MLSTRSQNVVSSSTEGTSPLAVVRISNFKTPARPFKHGRAIHDENSVYGHPKTPGFTGRKKHKTLFSTPAVCKPSQSGLTTGKAPRSPSKSTALAEITNKTPSMKSLIPVTPGHVSLKPSKSFAIFNDDSIAPSARRISSTRKKLRLPRSMKKEFQTPETRVNYWDVSDVSIEASVTDDASVTEEDYDDVEYAPPAAVESAYDPGFEMPDYKTVGATLMMMFQQPASPDGYESASDFNSANFFKETGPIIWEKLELPDSPEGSFSIITHTRIPSLTKVNVVQKAPRTPRATLKSRTISLGHARTASIPTGASTTQTRIGSVTSNTSRLRSTNVLSQTKGIPKSSIKVASTRGRKPAVASQQFHVPDDTVLSLLDNSEKELSGEEFLFQV